MSNYILLYRGTSLVDKAIEWETYGAYSHAAMTDGTIIWESANGIGVRKRPYLPEPNRDIFQIDAPPTVIAWAASHEGEPYSYQKDLDIFLRKQPHVDGWICSEFVAEAFSQCGYPLLLRIPSYKVTPTLLSYSPCLTLCC